MQPYRSAAFHTLGCKLNFSETSTIARTLENNGFARVGMDEDPDVFVLNTCSVTAQADKKCRQVIKRVLRRTPGVTVVVTGCYAQLKPKEIAEMPGVDLVLGANEKFDVPAFLERVDKKQAGDDAQVYAGAIKHARSFHPSFSHGDRTRSFLKVQDGCDHCCSFCTIPFARGRSRSATVEETLNRAREVAATEAREVVLTGVNIGDFGKGTEESFLDLIRGLEHVEGIDRFRISSIEPELLTDAIVDHVAGSGKFVPHFHIPLQSGSDEILARMRRKYDTDLYRGRVEKVLDTMPHAAIGVDAIVGFPGESESHFMETYDLLKDLDVAYLHAFTYSDRERARASRMDDKVPMETRKERSRMLRILSEKKKQRFYRDNIGGVRHVLFEATEHEGCIEGYTENYVRVRVPWDASLIGHIRRVSLQKMGDDGLVHGMLPPAETEQGSKEIREACASSAASDHSVL